MPYTPPKKRGLGLSDEEYDRKNDTDSAAVRVRKPIWPDADEIIGREMENRNSRFKHRKKSRYGDEEFRRKNDEDHKGRPREGSYEWRNNMYKHYQRGEGMPPGPENDWANWESTDSGIVDRYMRDPEYRAETLRDLEARGYSGEEGDDPPPDYAFGDTPPEMDEAWYRGVRRRKQEQERARGRIREPRY